MFGGLPGSKQKIGQSFARGTTLLFWQAVAPIGWTRIVTQNDKLLRVVSANGGPLGGGGTNAFSVVNAQTVVGNHTLSTAECPTGLITGNFAVSVSNTTVQFHDGTGQTLGTNNSNVIDHGGNGSHNHTITMSIQYIDVILASKN